MHSLRATSITAMVNKLRLPLGDVAGVVGHDDIRVTESYREPDETMLRQGLASLSGALLTAGGQDFPAFGDTNAVWAAQEEV